MLFFFIIFQVIAAASEPVPIEAGYYILQSDILSLAYPRHLTHYLESSASTGLCIGTFTGGLTCGATCPFLPNIVAASLGLGFVSYLLGRNKLAMDYRGMIVWQIEPVDDVLNAFTMKAVSPSVCSDNYNTDDSRVSRFESYLDQPMVAYRSGSDSETVFVRTVREQRKPWLHAGHFSAGLHHEKSRWTFLRVTDDDVRVF